MEMKDTAALTCLLLLSASISAPGTHSEYRTPSLHMKNIDENAFYRAEKSWEILPELTGRLEAPAQSQQIETLFVFARKIQLGMTSSPEECESIFQEHMQDLLA